MQKEQYVREDEVRKLVAKLRKYDDRQNGVPIVEEAAEALEELLFDNRDLRIRLEIHRESMKLSQKREGP